MTADRRLRPLALALALAAGGASAAPAPATLAGAWQRTAQIDFAGALADFTALTGSADAAVAREARYGRAVALLNAPPVTPARLREADELFAATAAGASDDLALGARFYRARLRQLHFDPPDLAEARALFAALAREHPAHFYGQYAFVELVTLDLHSTPLAPGIEARVLEWYARAAAVTHPALRRGLLRNLSHALTHGDGSASAALPLEREIVALRFSRQDQRRFSLLRLFLLAEATGDRATQIEALEAYLPAFPRHPHRQFYADKLAALKGDSAPP